MAVSTLAVTLAITHLGVEADLGPLREGGGGAQPAADLRLRQGIQHAFLICAGIAAVGLAVTAVR